MSALVDTCISIYITVGKQRKNIWFLNKYVFNFFIDEEYS